MNRRRLLQGVVAGAAGLLLPPSVGEVAAEVERRYWALGQMPERDVSHNLPPVWNGYVGDLEPGYALVRVTFPHVVYNRAEEQAFLRMVHPVIPVVRFASGKDS